MFQKLRRSGDVNIRIVGIVLHIIDVQRHGNNFAADKIDFIGGVGAGDNPTHAHVPSRYGLDQIDRNGFLINPAIAVGLNLEDGACPDEGGKRNFVIRMALGECDCRG